MDAIAAYAWLTEGGESPLRDCFDAHIIGCALAVAIAEADASGLSLTEGTGLAGPALHAFLGDVFPHSLPLLESYCKGRVSVSEDEMCLRELLARFSTHGTPFQQHLAVLIARRAMRPNHLWQDMGLRNRGEVSALFRKHFKPLATRNVGDMKWKKFLYRIICREEGFRLCTTPSCSECDDFSLCFGEESGESLLARSRNFPSSLLPSDRLVKIRPV